MKTTRRHASRVILAVVVIAPWPLALSGCGDSGSQEPPKSVSGLKTPSDILKEAKAKEPAKKP